MEMVLIKDTLPKSTAIGETLTNITDQLDLLEKSIELLQENLEPILNSKDSTSSPEPGPAVGIQQNSTTDSQLLVRLLDISSSIESIHKVIVYITLHCDL